MLGTWTFNALLGLTFRKVMKLSAADAFGNPIGKVSSHCLLDMLSMWCTSVNFDGRSAATFRKCCYQGIFRVEPQTLR